MHLNTRTERLCQHTFFKPITSHSRNFNKSTSMLDKVRSSQKKQQSE